MEQKEHKPKFSIATRAQAMTLRHCGYSFKNIELQTGITERQLQHIIRTAKSRGYDAEKSFRLEDEHFPDGHKTGRPRKFTDEQAEALLEAAKEQPDGTKKTNAVLAKEFGVSERTVRRRRIQQENAAKRGIPRRKSEVATSTPKSAKRTNSAPEAAQQTPQAQGGIQQQLPLPEPLQQQNQNQTSDRQQQHQHQDFQGSLTEGSTPSSTEGGRSDENFEEHLMQQLQNEAQHEVPIEHHSAYPEIGLSPYAVPSPYHAAPPHHQQPHAQMHSRQ